MVPKDVQAAVVSVIFWSLLLPLTLLILLLRQFVQVALNVVYPNRRYTLASNIDSLFAHDTTPGSTAVTHQYLIHQGSPDIAKIRERYANNVLGYRDPRSGLPIYAQRLQRKFVRDKWGWSVWEDCTSSFDICDHIRLVQGLGDRVTEDDLFAFLSTSFQQTMSDDRPQWEHLIVPNYFPPGADDVPHYVSVVRTHHSYADGGSLIIVIDTALGDTPITWSVNPYKKTSPLKENLAKLQAYLSGPLPFLETLRSAYNDRSPFVCLERYSDAKCLGWSAQLNMNFFKELSSASGTSFSSIILSGVCGALKKLHLRRKIKNDCKKFEEEPAPEVNVAVIAVLGSNIGRKMQNSYSAFSVPASFGESNVIVRLKANDTALKKCARSSAPLFNLFIMKWASLLPRKVQKTLVDIAGTGLMMSNVPGPSAPFHMFGSEVIEMGGMIPLVKKYSVGFVPFSYQNKMRLCISADCTTVPSRNELRKIFDDFHSEMEVLARLFNIKTKLYAKKMITKDDRITATA